MTASALDVPDSVTVVLRRDRDPPTVEVLDRESDRSLYSGRLTGLDPEAALEAVRHAPPAFRGSILAAVEEARRGGGHVVLMRCPAPQTLREQTDPLARPACLLGVVPEPLAYHCAPLLLSREINAIAGETGSLKTTALLHLAAATASGYPAFNALSIERPGPVLILSGEDEASVLRNRVEAFCLGHDWDVDHTLRHLHVWDRGIALDDPEWETRIVAAARALDVCLIVADPLRDVAGPSIDENSNSDAAKINAVFRRIIDATDATIAYAAHVSKPSEGKERRHRFRGASAWLAGTRLAWWAEPVEGGLSLLPLKGNRSGRLAPLTLRLLVTAPDGLNWRAARFDLDGDGDVTHRDVVRVLEVVGSATSPPTSRAVRTLLRAEGLGNDHADAALAEARSRSWVEWQEGPRRAHLWTLTETGRARRLLAGGERA